MVLCLAGHPWVRQIPFLRVLPSLKHHNLTPYNRIRDYINSNSNFKTPQSSKKMENIREGQNKRQERQVNSGRDSSSSADTNPKVNKMQGILHSNPSGGWEKSWEEEITPWDLGQPTPVIVHLLKTDALPKGRALVPGCGSGHDVVAIACPERFVVGLDIADKAIKKAKEWSSTLPNADHCTFLKEDFFNWRPKELFDLIFDYTFFCAIEPEMRSAWARQVQDLLKPDGELITLMFPMDDHVGGPPYAVSVADYEEVLHPFGFKAVSIVENELAVAPRKGREKLGRWKRFTSPSSL